MPNPLNISSVRAGVLPPRPAPVGTTGRPAAKGKLQYTLPDLPKLPPIMESQIPCQYGKQSRPRSTKYANRYVGLPLGAELARRGHEVCGVTRSARNYAALKAASIQFRRDQPTPLHSSILRCSGC
jgi:hypothetical protein